MSAEGGTNFVALNEAAAPVFAENNREELVYRLLQYLGLDGIEVGVNILSAGEVRILNRDYRHIDTTTDILSFAMLENEGEPATPMSIAARLEKVHQSGESPVLLGDIVISSAELDAAPGWVDGHLMRLVIHGILHLIGHDHEEEEARAAMEILEEESFRHLFGDQPDSPAAASTDGDGN
jgi:probable rRNA maturation factor